MQAPDKIYLIPGNYEELDFEPMTPEEAEEVVPVEPDWNDGYYECDESTVNNHSVPYIRADIAEARERRMRDIAIINTKLLMDVAYETYVENAVAIEEIDAALAAESEEEK